jgi:hypothetical protein
MRKINSVAAVGSALVVLGFAAPASANYIVNGGFETGDFAGWTVNANNTHVEPSGFDGLTAESGSYFAALGNVGGLGTLSQSFADTPGDALVLSMAVFSDGGTPSEFAVSYDGTILVDSIALNSSRSNIYFYVVGTGLDTLTLYERNDPGYIGLDNVGVSAAVPEPETYAMLLAGLGLLGYVARRRKQKAA